MLISQTFEHILEPLRAAMMIFDQVEPGGYVFSSTPVFSRPHGIPIFYQLFTPIGHTMVWARAGFEILEVGFWGNRDYQTIMSNAETLIWPELKDLKKPIKNNLDRAVGSWVLCRRPK